MKEDMDADESHGLSDDQLGELARLADGSLPADERAEVEAHVAASPELARVLERQRVALAALDATADVGAPARLHARVRQRRAPARGRRRRLAVGGAVAVAAAAALALALVLPATSPVAPTPADVAAVASQPPDEAAPAGVPGTPQLLREQVDGVAFPNYAAKFGYEPVGARHVEVSGRAATTVYYAGEGRTIAYTIASGDGLEPPADARSTTRGGVEYRSFRAAGRDVVTWERDGHTCVLSSTAAPTAELIELADWRGKGAIEF